MNSLVVLVACAASLVHAAPNYWAGQPAHPGAAHPGPAHPGYAHPGPAHVATSAWHGPLATPVVLPSGYLADTPEVAALKSVHTAPFAYAPAHGHAAAPGPRWHGPLAVPVVLPSGYLADTPEVAALKSGHVASLGASPVGYAAGHGHVAAHGGSWHGPLATPVVLPSGYLADTPEVAALKTAHVATVAGSHGHGYYHH